jgi:hypothetical protein
MGFCSVGEERVDVLPSIGSRATQFTLLVKMPAVVEARHVAEMNVRCALTLSLSASKSIKIRTIC